MRSTEQLAGLQRTGEAALITFAASIVPMRQREQTEPVANASPMDQSVRAIATDLTALAVHREENVFLVLLLVMLASMHCPKRDWRVIVE